MLSANLSGFVSSQSGVIQDINNLSSTNDSLVSQLSAAQAQVASLQQQLAAVNLDDASAQAQVLALTQQLQTAQAQVVTLQAQLAVLEAQPAGYSLQDILTGKVTVTVFAALQTHKRSPQVAGTTINQDQEIMLQWGDPGGTKADSNPNTVVKPHGLAVFTQGVAPAGPAHLAFPPAAVGDNEYLFMDLPTPAVPPNLFYSSRTYQCTAAEFAALICPESDSQFIWAGWIYNMGTQGNAAGWKFYQYGAPGHWNLISPVISVPDFVSVPVKFDVMSTIDTVAHTVTRLAMRINNGPWIPVNMVMPAYNTGNATLNKYTCAVQLDPKSTTPTGMTIIDAEERYLTVAA